MFKKGKKSSPKKSLKKIVIANWKMNPTNLKEAQKIFSILKRTDFKKVKSQIVICPPISFLADFSLKYKGNKFKFGSQDISISNNPESTGEISGEMIKNLNAEYVIIGHSERRALGEGNEKIKIKIKRAFENNLKVILCVGENIRDNEGLYLRFLEKQIFDDLEGVNKKMLNNLIVAYEPVWAIGRGHSAISSSDLHQISLFIKKVLVKVLDRNSGMNIPILYGGSVDDENVKELMSTDAIDGFLIGRASLNPYVFAKILKSL